MADFEKGKNRVVFEREIVTDGPNASATLKLEVEGMPESVITKIRTVFLETWKSIEEQVRKETGLANEPGREVT